jgi:hypothetical protein
MAGNRITQGLRRWWPVVAVALAAVVGLIVASGARPADAQFPEGFGTSMLWNGMFCVGSEVCDIGDFNGDGRDDIIAFVRSTKPEPGNGDVWVAPSTGSAFSPASAWHALFCVGDEICATGDFNGDGKDDIAAFVRSTKTGDGEGDVWVALSTGSSFSLASPWHSMFCVGNEVCRTGDVNGDGLDDIIAFVREDKVEPGRGDVWVALSTGSGFGAGVKWHDIFCTGAETRNVADVNGDGMDDIIAYQQYPLKPANTWVALSTGAAFGSAAVWYDDFCAFGESVCTTGDVNGDSRADAVIFLRNAAEGVMGYSQRQGRVDVATSTGAAFASYTSQKAMFCTGDEICTLGDANGDGKDDLIAFIRSTKTGDGEGDVWVALSELGGLSIIQPIQPIQPVQVPPVEIAPIEVQPIQPLPGAVVQAVLPFTVGDTVVVTLPGTNLTMRTAPGLQFAEQYKLPLNTYLNVLEGPITADGYTWWRVSLNANPTQWGWVAQGDSSQMWLQKIQ